MVDHVVSQPGREPEPEPEPELVASRGEPEWLARFEQRRWLGPMVTAGRRFFSIEGLDLGGLIALELFTTVMPLLLIFYAWAKDFDPSAQVGDVFIGQMGASGSAVERIRAEFGAASGLASTWTLVSMAGFLVWGIPMSLTVARMFATAWLRPQYSIGQRLWRGTLWFCMYLAAQGVIDMVMLVDVPAYLLVVKWGVSFAASMVFWGLSPVLLVPGLRLTRWQFLAAGLTGAIINVIILRTAVRAVFPLLLSGWEGFGGIGVALAMMTWSGVLGVVWVVVACAGAVFTERHSPEIYGRPAERSADLAG
jgi:hypothetical protein